MFYEVEDIFVGSACNTRVWMSQKAKDAIKKFHRKHRKAIEDFMQLLKRCSESGFVNFEGSDKQIRPYSGGVFRIGLRKSLFRLLGFYETESRTSFIAIDFYLKRGQDANPALVRAVQDVKAKGTWRKNDYPRPAQYI